ncbi:MAG: hypothetical protein JOY99_14125 [Sphingomonadaceae bacterium]|nr:hypothetical protein [Sphingomonadaceae bacterium]
MLRAAVNAVAALFLAVALALTVWQPLEWPLLIGATMLAAGCLFERWRYARAAAAPPAEAGWAATGERFVDPETGHLVAVYYHAATGARRYVEAD